MDTKHVPGETLDIKEMNIQNLKALFPEAFTEGKIDFDKLKQLLGEYVDDSTERYNFTWNGKGQSLRFSQSTSTGTLRPCPEESKDWDTTNNLYIEGDNLEVLKLFQKSYFGKVKMIYIDPPYNTGNDFVYPDDFKDSIENYKKITGQVNAEGNAISTNTESNGRYHTDWLNMMYPRLRLARNLLADNGYICISIGEEEVQNLISSCNELFGEENRVTICSRVVKTGGQKGTHFSPSVDYILIYAKSLPELAPFRTEISQKLIESVYTKIETQGVKKGQKYRSMGLYQAMLDVRANQRYYIKCPDGELVIPPGKTFPVLAEEGQQIQPNDEDGVWRWTYNRYREEFANNNIEFVQSERTSLVTIHGNPAKWNVYYKIWLNDRLDDGQLPGNILEKFESRHSSAELKSIDIPFDFAKPSELVKYLISISKPDNDEICLDFFSGSGTLGHSVYDYEANTNTKIKFICVQLPEKTSVNSEEYKSGYKNICEIGKERLRRAGEKIKQDNPDAKNLDIGFKVLKLDTSNIKRWNPDTTNLETTLEGSVSNWIPGRTDLDVVYEILIKLGLPLDIKVEHKSLNGKTIYTTGSGALIVCLADGIDLEIVKKIIEIKETEKPETCKIVFRDNGFKTDSDKTNVLETLRAAGIEEILSI